MSKLIAKRNILFDGKQYKVGDELPTYNAEMVEQWLKYSSAEFTQQGNAESSESEETEPEDNAESHETEDTEPEDNAESHETEDTAPEDTESSEPKTRGARRKG